MTNKSNKIGKNKKYLIDKTAVWGLPLIFFIIFFLFIFLINYFTGPSAAAVAKNTPFFAVYKVLLSLGIPLILIGSLLISSSVFPIDTYSKINSSYLFANHWHTSFFKVLIIVIGLILSFLSHIFTPEIRIPYTSYTFWDYVLIVIGILFILGIAIQIINSVRSLIQNKGDYILIDDDKIEWFDDKNNCAKEIKFSDIKSCKPILEETDESPEIIGILFNSGIENELKIDFESMSLTPQSKFIYDIISKKNPENINKE